MLVSSVCGMLGRVKVLMSGPEAPHALPMTPVLSPGPLASRAPTTLLATASFPMSRRSPISDLRHYWEPDVLLWVCVSISLHMLLLEAHFRQVYSYVAWGLDSKIADSSWIFFKVLTCSLNCEVAIYECFTTPDINSIFRQFVFWSVCCISPQIALPSSVPPAVGYSLKKTWRLLNNRLLFLFCLFNICWFAA